MERDLARLQQAALLSAAGTSGSLSASTSGSAGASGDTGGACLCV